MKHVKKFFSVFAVTALLFGAVVAAPVATAEKAQAYTATQCHTEWFNGWRAYTVCYYDYDWWEESPWGGSHVDGWYRTGTASA